MTGRAKLVVETALRAGGILKKYFGVLGLSHAKFKKGVPINLVSVADTEAQQCAVKIIRKHCPNDPILAEEGELAKQGDHLQKGPLWIIDPLDGTVNFLHGFPLFAVSVAYCEDAKPLIGAIYHPVTDELFWAQRGKGAYCIRAKVKKKLSVTKTKNLSDSLLITGFGYDRRENADFYLDYYRAFLKVSHDVRRTGAACIDLAWIAAGRADGFWEWKLNPWDVAAGLVLVEEAGGQMTHLDGLPYSVFKSEQTLATNGKIHRQCLDIISSVA